MTWKTLERKHWKGQVPYDVLQPCPQWQDGLDMCLAPFHGLLFNYLFIQTLSQTYHIH